MDPNARRRFVEGPWVPKTYTPLDIIQTLRVHPQVAIRIILDCNGTDTTVKPYYPFWCTHHDLVQYLRDMMATVELDDASDLSVHGKWLHSTGWRRDQTRNMFRWIDPEDSEGRYKLNAALAIALGRLQEIPEWLCKPEPPDTSIMDAEFQIRPLG